MRRRAVSGLPISLTNCGPRYSAPLGEIGALLEGIRSTTPESIRSLHAEALRLHRLVDDLYQLSLSDLGTLTYRKEDIDLVEVFDDSIEPYFEELTRKNITLTKDIPPGSKLIVFADAERMHQLFANLIDNSLKYTDAGGELVMRLTCLNNRTVIDFEAHSARSSGGRTGQTLRPPLSGGGFQKPGIGRCRARPGNLQKHRRGPCRDNLCASFTFGRGADQGHYSGCRWKLMSGNILIVEDEPKLASLLYDYLRASGFEPFCLSSGAEVVPWFREHTPDLILLDLMLPGRDGGFGSLQGNPHILACTDNHGDSANRRDRPPART